MFGLSPGFSEKNKRHSAAPRLRRALLERLEDRSMMASLPYGATAADTGEYMLGKVHVTVVLMESTPTMSPGDNGVVRITPTGGSAYNFNYIPENWNSTLISSVKNKVIEATNWWEQTLDTDPNVRDGLLDYSVDFTYADSPVPTGYEPIARPSNDFALWIYDFLNTTGLPISGNFSTDIRTFNNFQRERTGSDWAFTLFVVNDTNDADKQFDPSGAFDRSFAYAGGRFAVVLASRPASIFAHEIGHQFWALDEYAGLGNYSAKRGYYNTQNVNSAENPTPGFSQQPSLMSNDPGLTQAYNSFTTSDASKQMIGWQDSDGDGIFDVLDVPFSLSGSGSYNASTGMYNFKGASSVETLANLNTSGLGNDITINKIRVAEYAIDNGPWQVAATYENLYSTSLDLSFPVPAGDHEIRIRTHDTVTGAMSPEFIASTRGSSAYTESGIAGYLYRDDNDSGTWDVGESPLAGWNVRLVDDLGQPLQLSHVLEPNDYANSHVLSTQLAGIRLSVQGGDSLASNRDVTAVVATIQPSAGKVFGGRSAVFGNVRETWSSTRFLKIEFDTPQSSVSIKAYSGGTASYGRLEAYDATGKLIERYTTSELTGSSSEVMRIERPDADVSYVIARGHMGTEVVLDSLEVGPATSTVTDANGAYVLPLLPSGTFNVAIEVLPTYEPTTALGSEAEVIVSAGETTSDVNFGFAPPGNPWTNPFDPLNVSDDRYITPFDALLVINWLNQYGQNPTLPAIRPDGNYFIDVNNDGRCTPFDALLVINHLNLNGSTPAIVGESEPPADGGENGSGDGGTGDGGTGGSGTGEGGTGDGGSGSGGGSSGGGSSGTIIELPGGPAGEGEPSAEVYDLLLAIPVTSSAATSELTLPLTDDDAEWLALSGSSSLASYVDQWAVDLLAEDGSLGVLKRRR